MNGELKEELIESYRKPRELTPFERVIANAVLIAGITFFSTLSIEYPPTAQNLWAASIAAILVLITQFKMLTDPDPSEPKRPLGMLI